MKKNITQLFGLLSLGGLCFLLLFPYPLLASHRFLMMSLMPLLLVVALYIQGEKSIMLLWWDWVWMGFLTLGLLTYTWAANGSLVWFPWFTWFTLIGIMILIRSHIRIFNDVHRQKIVTFFAGMFGIVLMYVLAIHAFSLPQKAYLAYNMNYLSMLTIVLFPFAWFLKKEGLLSFLIKSVALVGLIYVIYLSRARGSALIFLIMMLGLVIYELWQRSSSRGNRLIKNVFLLVFGLIFFAIYLNRSTVIEHFGELSDDSRVYMMLEAIKLAEKNPVGGVAWGNWSNHAYAFNEDDNSRSGHANKFFELKIHNLYGLILGESGFLGLLLYLAAIVSLLYQNFKRFRNLDRLAIGAIFSLIAYLLGNIFYLSSFSFDDFYSGIQLVGFFSLAILSVGSFKDSKRLISSKTMIFIVLIPIIWFSYYLWTDTQYKKASHPEISNEHAIALLSKIYHPAFKTSHGYKKSGGNLSLDLVKARHYFKLGDVDNAVTHLERGILKFPNDPDLLLAQVQHLDCDASATDGIVEMLRTIYLRNTSHVLVAGMMVKNYIEAARKDSASIIFNQPNLNCAHPFLRMQYVRLCSVIDWKAKLDLSEIESVQIQNFQADLKNQLVNIDDRLCLSIDWMQEIADLKRDIDSMYRVTDLFFVENLNDDRAIKYLSEHANRFSNWQLNRAIRVIKLDETQAVEMFEDMKEIFTQQKFHLIKRSSKKLPNKVRVQHREEQGKLEKVMEERIVKILNKDQQQKFDSFAEKEKKYFVAVRN